MTRALLIALALWAAPALAQDQIPGPPQESSIQLGPSECGLVSHYASHLIGDGCYQVANNIVFDDDLGIQRRRGYAAFNAVALSSPAAIRRVYQYDAPDGNHYIVAVSSDKLWYATNAGNFTALTGVVSGSENTSCTQVLGKFWCVNKVNGLFYWDGVLTSTTAASAGPLGGLISNFRNRVLIADVASNQSRLYASGFLDGTDWTTASQSTSPFIQPITGVNDGEKITCLMGTYQDAFVIGTPNRLFGLYGFDNNDFQVRELSREVGCIENTSVQEFDGSLVWLSRRGIERLRGTSIDWRVSDPIFDILQTIVASAGNTVTLSDTSQSDFEAGNLSASGPGAPLSATLSVNNVVSSTFGVVETSTSDWFAGTITNLATTYVDTQLTLSTQTAGLDDFGTFPAGCPTSGGTVGATWNVRSGSWDTYPASVGEACALRHGGTTHTAEIWTNAITPNAGQYTITFRPSGCGVYYNTAYVYFMASTTDSSTTDGYALKYYSLGGSNGLALFRVDDGALTELATSGSSAQLCDSLVYVTTISVSSDGTFTVEGSNYPGTPITTTLVGHDTTYSGGAYYIIKDTKVGAENGTFSSIVVPKFRTSGSYLSPTYNTGVSTPTWGPFDVMFSSNSEATLTFQVQTSNNGSSWGSLETQTPDLVMTATPKQYFRYKANFATSITSKTASMDRVSLLAATTGYFISQCRNPGTTITSWGLFQCNQTLPTNVSMSLWVATGANCGAAISPSTAPWVSQTNNTVISVATAPYVAYRILFTFTSATQAINGVTLQDCAFTWNEGAARPESASAVIDHKYHLFYTTRTATGAVNSNALVLDYYDRWSTWDDIPARTAATFQNPHAVVIGDGASNGKLYRLYSGYNDAGADFTSRFRTKDFDAGDWKRRKEFIGVKLELSPLRDPADLVTLTVTGHVDKSTTTFALNTVSLGEDTGLVYGNVPTPLDSQTSGRYIGFDVSNTGSKHWRFYRGALQYRPLRED